MPVCTMSKSTPMSRASPCQVHLPVGASPCQVHHLVKCIILSSALPHRVRHLAKCITLSCALPCQVRHPGKVLSTQQFLSSACYSVLSVFLQQVIIYFNIHTVFCFVTIPTVYFSCVNWIYVLLFTVKVWFTACFCMQTGLGSNS